MNNTTAQLHNATINIKASRYDCFLYLRIDIIVHKHTGRHANPTPMEARVHTKSTRIPEYGLTSENSRFK